MKVINVLNMKNTFLHLVTEGARLLRQTRPRETPQALRALWRLPQAAREKRMPGVEMKVQISQTLKKIPVDFIKP